MNIPKIEPKSKNSLQVSLYDQIIWDDILKSASNLSELCESGTKQYSPFTDLTEDLYLSLYKHTPEFMGAEDMMPTHKLNHEFVTKNAQESKEWKKLRISTRGDQTLSAVGAICFGNEFQERISESEELKKQVEAANRMTKDRQRLQDFLNKAKLYSEAADKEPDPEQAKELMEKANRACRGATRVKKKIDELTEEFQASLGSRETEKQIQFAFQEAAKAAQGKVSCVKSALEVWGSEAGSLEYMPIDERLKLAEQMISNKKLRNIADLIGKNMNMISAAERIKVKADTGEIHDITIGNDLRRVLPSELALLARPATKLLFYQKYMERSLLQYDLQDFEPKGKGAMIVLTDTSGSMKGPRDEWAKAIGISLLFYAQDNNRCFEGIVFSGPTQDMQEFYFGPGEKNLEKTMGFATAFKGGGTNFENPINRAVEVISLANNLNVTNGLKDADIILISDGISRVSEEFLDKLKKAKEKLKIKIHTILIQTMQEGYVSEFSDSIHHVQELDGTGVLTIMESIV
jgi:uncharacterized protein with von Willebrand factor type A (vWA) domain